MHGAERHANPLMTGGTAAFHELRAVFERNAAFGKLAPEALELAAIGRDDGNLVWQNTAIDQALHERERLVQLELVAPAAGEARLLTAYVDQGDWSRQVRCIARAIRPLRVHGEPVAAQAV